MLLDLLNENFNAYYGIIVYILALVYIELKYLY